MATGFIFIRDYLRQFMQGTAHICSRNFIGHGQGGRYTRINWKGVEGQESYIIVIIIIVKCSRHRESVSILLQSLLIPRACQAGYSRFLRVRHSLAERYRSVVVSIRFGEKWAFFQSSGNIAFG